MSDTGITVLRLRPSLDPTACDELLRDLKKARNTAVVVEAGDVMISMSPPPHPPSPMRPSSWASRKTFSPAKDSLHDCHYPHRG